MIKSWLNKGLKDFFETGSKKGIPPELAARIRIRLDALNAAVLVTDLDLPGFKLHELKGDRKGTWSIWVNGNWWITFGFVGGEATDANLEDYH